MPVIGISVQHLNSLLHTSLSPQALTESLKQLGCDPEEPTEVTLYECPRCQVSGDKLSHEEAPRRCPICGYEGETSFAAVGTDQVIRLDLLAARPDFFDPGGLARSLKGYLGIETGLPHYHMELSPVRVEVSPDLSLEKSYRPFIGCAVVTMPAMDGYMLRVLMKLQENLHWGVGRDRKLSSIGVYDLDTITPPIFYKTVSPEGIEFYPLGSDEKMTPAQILARHPKGVSYAHLLTPYEAYPLLRDSRGQVLSMPPIINSSETKVKIGTTRLFIDVTGITASDVTKTLNTLVSSILEMGGKGEGVTVHTEEGEKVTPDLTPGEIKIALRAAEKWLGFELKSRDLVKYLEKMRLSAQGKGQTYHVRYPAFRTDIKHEVDVFEDIAIAYGFDNLPLQTVATMTIGEERLEERISQLARQVMLGMGFTEIFSLMLTSEQNHFVRLRLTPAAEHILLLNSKMAEYNVVRCHLMTGLMESLAKNRHKAVPQKFFEIGNVLRYAGEGNIPHEERRLGFAIIGPDTGYAEIRSVLDTILKEFQKEGRYEAMAHPSFIVGRAAQVTASDMKAYVGEIHPEILENFGLSYPVSLGELALTQVI